MLMNLLPQPKKIISHEGTFHISRETEIVLRDFDSPLTTATWLQNKSKKILGFTLKIIRSLKESKGYGIYLKIQKGNPQSYQLHVKNRYIEIIGGDKAGLFYGVQTLCQLMMGYFNKIPCALIEGAPAFGVRGFYHDVTRGKVPRLDTLKTLADMATSFKINQIQLYVEHSFTFKSHSEVWMEADPLTPEEIILFDAYCKERYIELVPSLATFGHLYEALSTQSFAHLCELENSIKERTCFIERQAHHTLDVNHPDSLKFVRDMLEQFIPLFSSNKFNICADETFDLGVDKNKELVEKEGKGNLYVRFLNHIFDMVKGYNKQVMFWGDIIVNYPELMSQIPKDVICLDWDYDKEPGEDKRRIIAESGRDFYLCSGIVGWSRFMNDMDTAYSNISTMVQYGTQYGANGILNTDWGDYGHINLFANLLSGLVYGAALSWNPEEIEGLEAMNESIAKLHYGNNNRELINLLLQLSRQQAMTFREMVKWLERHDFSELKEYPEEEVHSRYDKAMAIGDEIVTYYATVNQDQHIDIEEFYVSAKGIGLMNSLYLILQKYEKQESVKKLIHQPKDLAVEIEYWIQDYNRVWRKRNKESELFKIKDMFKRCCKALRLYK